MTVTSVHDPSHREALWTVEDGFERGDLVTLFGRCTVSYEGRAASDLGSGDRLLVLKPDGTALVHTDEGREPVNWQPPGSAHHVAVRDGHLRVRSTRRSPDETLTVRFERVEHLTSMTVTGGRDLTLHGTEADLKTRVVEHPDLIEPGFVPKATERETNAGPIDVFGVDTAGRPVVVELKRRRVGPDAVGQLARYVRAIREEQGGRGTRVGGDGTDEDGGTAHDGTDSETVHPDSRDTNDDSPSNPSRPPVVRGVLVAPSITDRAAERLNERGFEYVSLDPTEDVES